VRSDLVVALDPFGGDFPHLLQGIEHIGAQHLLVVGSVEAFDIGVLVGLARLDESQLDVLLLAPIGEGLAHQLRAVIAANSTGPAVQVNHLGQERDRASGGNAHRDIDPEGPAIGFIDHVVRAEHPPAVERVTHKVDRPHGIHPWLHHQGLALPLRHSPLGPTREIEPQLAIHPPDPFVVPTIALCPQSIVALPETPTLLLDHDRLRRRDELIIAPRPMPGL